MTTRDLSVRQQLQLNNAGLWRTIAMWSGHDVESRMIAKRAAELIGLVNPSFPWRVATVEALPKVLELWTAHEGWRPQ